MNQAQQLRDGIQALGLDIDDAKQAKLLDYAALLQRRVGMAKRLAGFRRMVRLRHVCLPQPANCRRTDQAGV